MIGLKLTCTECGGRAEGSHSWTDGSGEICDSCVEKDATTLDSGIMIRTGRAWHHDEIENGIEVQVTVYAGSGGVDGRRVSGTAIVAPEEHAANADGFGRRPLVPVGDSLDCWLSGGIVVLLRDYNESERREAMRTILSLVCDAASDVR